MKNFKTIFCLLIALNSFGQEKRLAIGDDVPDFTIKDVINYTNPELKLSEFKGKAIILDFWGSSCAPCILALPKLDSLQKEFKDDLQILTISNYHDLNTAKKSVKKNDILSRIALPIGSNNSILKILFPFREISHLVWINKEGKIKEFTTSEYVNQTNVRKLVRGEDLNLPVKWDFVEYDYNKPFLTFSQPEIIKPATSYYSTMNSYTAGVDRGANVVLDTPGNSKSVTFYNKKITALATLALDYKFVGIEENQFIFNVKDMDRVIMPAGMYISEWDKLNRFTYSARLPMNLTDVQFTEFIKNDILKWLNLMGFAIEKDTIVKEGKTIPIYIISDQKVDNLTIK